MKPIEQILTYAQAAGKGFDLKQMLVSFGPFILIIIVMYFLLFRSQRKQAQRRKAMLEALKAGDRVVTNGGIYGTITSVKDKSMMVKIADNVKIEVSRASVSGIIGDNA